MTMKPERLQRSDEILQGALELAPEERGAFLDEACAGDEVMRQKVESLLAAAQQMGGFMEEIRRRPTSTLFPYTTLFRPSASAHAAQPGVRALRTAPPS